MFSKRKRYITIPSKTFKENNKDYKEILKDYIAINKVYPFESKEELNSYLLREKTLPYHIRKYLIKKLKLK